MLRRLPGAVPSSPGSERAWPWPRGSGRWEGREGGSCRIEAVSDAGRGSRSSWRWGRGGVLPRATADRTHRETGHGGKERGREKTRRERNPRGHFSLGKQADLSARCLSGDSESARSLKQAVRTLWGGGHLLATTFFVSLTPWVPRGSARLPQGRQPTVWVRRWSPMPGAGNQGPLCSLGGTQRGPALHPIVQNVPSLGAAVWQAGLKPVTQPTDLRRFWHADRF